MLQQQINYWNLKENIRHNKVGEGIYKQDADTNRINADTNIFNANVNAMNATSNRIQAGAAVTQAQAASRQAGVQERNVAVTEMLSKSKEFQQYASPFGSALGSGVNTFGSPIKGIKPKNTKVPTGLKVGADGFYSVKPTSGGLMAAASRAGLIGLGATGGVLALKTVYEYQKKEKPVIIKRTW